MRSTSTSTATRSTARSRRCRRTARTSSTATAGTVPPWRRTGWPSSASRRSTTSRVGWPTGRPTAARSSRADRPRLRSVEVVPQRLGPRGVTELGHRLGLDLPDPLARHAVDLADLIERLGLAVGQTEPHRHDTGLALGERVEHPAQLLAQQREAHRVDRDHRLGVLDEVAELAVALLAERSLQRDGLTAVLLDLHDLLRGHVELLSQLLGEGLATQRLEQVPLGSGELVDDLDHVHRDADGAGLVGHAARDRLPDPPRRVGRELEALGVVELLHRADQARVALLDEIQEQHAPPGVLLGDGDDQTKVRLEEVILRSATIRS